MLLMATVCESSGVLQAIYIIKQILMIIFILVPIVIIITSCNTFFKALVSNDDNEIKNAAFLLIKKILVGATIFFIPIIINSALKLVTTNIDDKDSYLECYTNATKERIKYYKAIEQREKEKEKEEYQNQVEANKGKDDRPMGSGNSSGGNNSDSSNNSSGGNNSSGNNYTGGSVGNKQNISGNMYIGDSRTVGMYFSLYSDSYANSISKTTGNDFWYASVGQGYSWFSSTAIYQIKSKLNSGNYNVTIQMGANDLTNSSAPSSYINTIKSLATSYPNSNFVVVSVNPIQDSNIKGYSVRNADVINFNNNLVSAFNSSRTSNMYFCDTYSKIIGSYSTTDGLHYTSNTYKSIYNAINNCL